MERSGYHRRGGAAERFDLAHSAILRVGAILRTARLEAGNIQEKTGHQDLVTYWDKETERSLRQTISEAFPQDAIVGEEYPAALDGGSGVSWYLDPIDGTTNFVSQHRNYAVSIGCWRGEAPLFGLVLDVERQALYSAVSGEGAWCGGKAIRTSSRDTTSRLLLATPGVLHTFLRPSPQRDGLIRLAGDVRGVRSLGSVALELCAVAAGEADIFIALRSSPWDHNAARIILAEAGGMASRLDGAPLPVMERSTVLAANSAQVHKRILMDYCGL